MTALELNEVEVILDIEPLGPRRMGTLYRQRARGAEIYSFEFDNDWLASGDAIALDPDLLPAPGRTYPPADRTQFGVFMDSAPDRWGRTLMQRREAVLAAEQKRPARTLTEWEYLLGVHDFSRLGALRFRADANSPYLDNSAVNAAPPLTSLRELTERRESCRRGSHQWQPAFELRSPTLRDICTASRKAASRRSLKT